MPHVAMVSLSGTRVRDAELAAVGRTLPGLRGRAEAISALPPLGLLTLAGMTPDDWTVSLHEVDGGVDAAAQAIASTRPTLAAMSALTASVEEAYRLAGLLRAEGIATALGGLHATACPAEAGAHVDAVVVGDGEPVWLELLHDAALRRLRKTYRAAAPFDLSHAPQPRLDLLGPATRPRYTVQTERGCPFACDFCGASRLLGPFREKPPERVREELAAIVARDAQSGIELADDNTFARRRDARELLSALQASGLPWFTEADWRIGEREELPRLLAESGCVQLLIGFESLVHRHGGMGAKDASFSRMRAAADRIQEAGIVVIGCFIVGSDGETERSIDELGNTLEHVELGDVQLALPTPFPGTELRRRFEREGRLLTDRGWSACTLFDVAFRPDAMTVESLERSFRELGERTYGTGESLRRSRFRRQIWRRSLERDRKDPS
jgi:radical SAM superfamily enzyme YgiQ (UPF0313 family)